MLTDASPLDSSLGFFVRRASRALTRFLDLAFEPVELRFSQVVLLRMIALGRSSHNQTELADLASMDQSSICRTLRPLTEKGFVELGDAERGPGKIPKLTERGRRKLDEALVVWEQVRSDLQNRLGRDSCSRLCAELDRLVETVDGEYELTRQRRWRAAHRQLLSRESRNAG